MGLLLENVLTSTELELELLWRFPSTGPRRVRMSAEEIRARVRFKQISIKEHRQRTTKRPASPLPTPIKQLASRGSATGTWCGSCPDRLDWRGSSGCPGPLRQARGPATGLRVWKGSGPARPLRLEPALGKRAGGTRPRLAGHNAGRRAEARGYHHRKATASPAPRAAGPAALSSWAKSS